MFYVVNRSVVVLKPKQPFLDWLLGAFPQMQDKISLESLRADCNSYLIPEVNDIQGGMSYIDKHFAKLFILELSEWSTDENAWPKRMSLAIFWQWFDIEVYPSMFDISSDDDECSESAYKAQSTTLH